MKCSNCGAGLTSPAGVSLTVCPFCNTDNSMKKQALASGGEVALREEFLRRGESLYKNSRVLGSLIGDFFADNQRLLKILQVAVRENLAAKIAELTAQSASEQKTRIFALLSIFANDYGMDKARAAEAVRVLAFGAGIADEILEELACTVVDSSQPTFSPPPSPQIGSIYQFGGIDWRVLDVQVNRALLLSDKILEQRPYHKDFTAITWENCTLRQHLNGEFLNKFSQTDRNRIISNINLNPKNQWYDTDGGRNTNDYIFLLNLEEVDRYFGNSGDYVNKRRKSYKDGKWVDDSDGRFLSNNYDCNRVATYNNAVRWWWLRSPGHDAKSAAGVRDDGRVYVHSDWVFSGGICVRPALWLKL